MRVRALLAVLLLVTVALAGCMGDPNRSAPNREVRRAWEQERDANAPMGLPATFDLSGAPLALAGDGRADLAAPFAFVTEELFPEDRFLLFFYGARVDGVGEGVVILEGARVDASAGTLAGAPVVGASVEPDVVALSFEGSSPGPRMYERFPPGWEDANRSWIFARQSDVAASGLVLSGYDRGVVFDANESFELDGTITLDADAVGWARGSVLEIASATVSTARFNIGGNVTGGQVSVAGHGVVDAPRAVFGWDGRIALEGGAARTLESFRATQVLTEEGFLVPAGVEVHPSTDNATVVVGGEEWVSISYRETSYRGDAVLGDVRIEGDLVQVLEVPVEKPPLIVEEMLAMLDQIAQDAPWMAPFAAIPLVIAAPFVAMLEAIASIACVFDVCPEKFPYPAWMDAGDVGVFYVKAKGSATPGTYSGRVVFEGGNYPDVSFPLTVFVTEASTTSSS